MMTRPGSVIAAVALLSTLSACGTSFAVPEASETSLSHARSMFAEERATGLFGPRQPTAVAVAQFQQVAALIEPVAEQFCRSQTEDRPGFNCDVKIFIDDETPDRNAYYTRGPRNEPVMGVTLPLIADARNPDELAFVLGHEFGHHIGDHIGKSQQQAMVGALILGAVAAYGQDQATAANPYRYTGSDAQQMDNAMGLGAAIGDQAYSQTYEFESDVIGTYITKAAGFDPVLGARSFWGTHPPSETRLATVLETSARIDAAPAGPSTPATAVAE